MVSKQTFIDRIKKEFPDAIENQTKSYISFQVKNRKGKLQNFIEINFQNKGIKIAILSKSLRDSDFFIFNKKPDSFGWTLDAEYFIKDENSLNEILPFINKSYEFVKSGINSECYKIFREFLSKFVNQANIYNSKDIEMKRSQKLDGAEHIYPALTIEGIPYKVEMLNTGHFGPRSGNGYIKSPYFGYRLSVIDNSWINIRCGFHRFKVTEFKIVKWYSNNQDEDLGYKYLVKDLELESTAEPNEILIEFYDNFTSFYREAEKEDINMSENINKYKNILLQSQNLILRGAPGTGKTYLAKEIALELTSGNEDQIGFVQFHPSYDYTDFVEGLRPVSNGDGAINFKLQDGIFKQFCQKAKEAQKTGGQDNFEETWTKLTNAINEKQGHYMFPRSSVPASLNSQGNVKFDSPVATKEKVYLLYKGEETNLKYETYQNIVLDHMKESYGLCDYVSPTDIDTDKNFVFIIDEINRGEISKIFGELFFSIDPGYRGEKGSVSTQYANLHETNDKFYIPENVYIIGTMNDIDRSVDTFDFAMRRRFRFVEVTAESQLGMLDDVLGDKAEEAKIRLRNLNTAIEKVPELNSHYHIGPSYFLKLEEVDYNYELLWSDYLKPLLEDYLWGSYEEAETLETLKKAFDLTKNEQKDQAVADDNEGDENNDADN
ncbi:AAA family ATPase [Streptococcus sp. SO4]|uniref:McrB family protein n=1 Tax=Streptococcus sp. SO4 TaxID=3018249 RepID=UPI00263CCC70|nr:AAA family ATPase [Streptococcus sp. SO4]MDN5024275.1 AAA family ATPase [Streptococcus sp. SO4]